VCVCVRAMAGDAFEFLPKWMSQNPLRSKKLQLFAATAFLYPLHLK